MTPFHTVLRAVVCTVTLSAAFAAHAAPQNAADGSAESRYQQDRTACVSGQTQQAREVCLREAGAARDAARKGTLASESQGDKAANAVERCDVFTKADEHAACLDRIRGAGNQSGSALQGGVLRESVTTTTTITAPK